MNRLKIHAGDALLRVASVLSHAGRHLLGSPKTILARDANEGTTRLVLESKQPLAIVQGFRLVGPSCDEIVRAVRVSGNVAEIDRPLAQSYPKGAEVRVLI